MLENVTEPLKVWLDDHRVAGILVSAVRRLLSGLHPAAGCGPGRTARAIYGRLREVQVSSSLRDRKLACQQPREHPRPALSVRS